MLLCPTLTINLDQLLWNKMDPTMPECVVPRNGGKLTSTVLDMRKLLDWRCWQFIYLIIKMCILIIHSIIILSAMRLSPQSQCHKLNYKLRLSTWKLLGQLTQQEVVQTFCLSNLQYCHYHLQDISSLIVQHPQKCSVDLTSYQKSQVFSRSNAIHCSITWSQYAGKEKIYLAGPGFGEWMYHIGNEEA